MRRKRGRESRVEGRSSRLEVAHTAARLMAEDSIHDFAEAKMRAAASLGVTGRQSLPTNQEIDAALREYQMLFQADTHPRWLAEKRRVAVAVMRLLAVFRPRLAGAVLRGTVVEDGEITLHLFVEPPERVATSLIDLAIPWEPDEWVGRFGRGEMMLPMYRIHADRETIRLIVFPENGLREAPRSSVDGRPMERAGIDTVEAMLQVTA